MTLIDRMCLAYRHLTRFLDESMDNAPYFYAFLTAERSLAAHDGWSFLDAGGRYLEALALLEPFVGTPEGADATERLFFGILRAQRDDGLFWRPDGALGQAAVANMFDQRSVLYALGELARTGDARAALGGARLVDALCLLLEDRGECGFFPYIDYPHRGALPDEGGDVDPLHYGGGVHILPLMRFYDATGNETALALAGKLARFAMCYSGVYASDGSFWSAGRTDCDGHVHSRMETALGVLRWGISQGDGRATAWGRRVFCWALGTGSRFGWFSEGLLGPGQMHPHSETCATLDMIGMALELGEYDCAERLTNHLIASQILHTAWAKDSTGEPCGPWESTDRVPQRYVGAFAGRTRPNDLMLDGALSTMGCCCASGAKALALIAASAVWSMGDRAEVRLWIDTDSPALDFRYDAEAGCALVFAKRDARVRLRIPEWLEPGDVSINPGTALVRGGYLELPVMSAGDMIEVRCPARVHARTENIAGAEYIVTWAGHRVLRVEPRGTDWPLYG